MNRKSSYELHADLQRASSQIQVGARYAHYRGQNYFVTGLAIIEATTEVGVIYKAEYGEKVTFVRPLGSFLDRIELEDRTVPRFKLIDER